MPTYRYFLDASLTYLFPPSLQYLGKCHGTDVAMLTIDWSTIPIPQPPQIFTLVSYFRDSFARFVANPPSGPGWPAFGDQRFSAFGYTDLVAVLGNVGSVPCGGATPISAAVVDARCKLYEPLYSRLEGEVG